MFYFIYFFALMRHKWYVFLECTKAGIPWQGITHDLSKFRPAEFVPYAHYWGKKPEDRTAAEIKAYTETVLSHKARNPHHWEWWVRGTVAEPMTSKYRAEMLCDWRGPGRAYNGRDKSSEFYEKNTKLITMHPSTRAWLEENLRPKKR